MGNTTHTPNAQGTIEQPFGKRLAKKSIAQGTIEYLVIIAVVVVVSLLVVGLSSSLIGGAGGTISASKKLGIGMISVFESVVDLDDDGLVGLQNNSGDVLTITGISVNGSDTPFDELLSTGNSRLFRLLSAGSCSCDFVGQSKVCDFVIYYLSRNGVANSVSISRSVDCVADANTTRPVVDLYDPTPPSVDLVSPSNGDNVSRSVTFEFSASDNVALARCDLYLDGVYDQNITSFDSLEFTKDFTEDKFYEWNVACVDTSGNLGSGASNFSLDVDENPLHVTTCLELQDMNQDLDGDYTLMNDINCYTDTHSGGALWEGGAGFKPIGDSYNYGFIGSFDGQNHVIYGLYINRPSDGQVGLLGYIRNVAPQVKNIGLIDANVTGGYTTGALIGGIRASTYLTKGYLENLYVTGNVHSVSGPTGCIIGDSWEDRVSISNSYSFCSVTADSGDVGGIAGGFSGDMNNSFSVNPTAGNLLLIGSTATIEYSNSFCSASVAGCCNSISGCTEINDASVFYSITHSVYTLNEPFWTFGDPGTTDGNWSNVCDGVGYPPLMWEGITDTADCRT